MTPSPLKPDHLTRTQWVHQLCDELASQRSKPTLRLVRARARVPGSDGDIQKDINKWFDAVFHRHAAEKADDQIPVALADAFRALWQTALAEGHKQFDVDRVRLVEDAEGLKTQLAEFSATNAELVATKLRLESEASVARESVVSLEKALEKSEAQLHDLGLRCDHQEKEVQSLNQQISALHESNTARITTLLREHESRVRELVDTHDRALKRLDEEHKARLSELREQMVLSEARYQALEQRSLREIDSAREATKERDRQLKVAGQSIAQLEAVVSTEKLAYGILTAKHEDAVAKTERIEKELLTERERTLALSMSIAKLQVATAQTAATKRKTPPAAKPE